MTTSLGTDEETAQYIASHLDDDLELLAEQQPSPPIRPANINITAANTEGSTPSYTLVLQVVSVQDVSQSLRQRLQSLVPDYHQSVTQGGSGSTGNELDNDEDNNNNIGEDGTAAAGNASGAAIEYSAAGAALQMSAEAERAAQQQSAQRRGWNSEGRWRFLKFILTDGYQRIVAVEDRDGLTGAAPPLLPHGVALGAKLRITVAGNINGDTTRRTEGARWTHGVLRLHGGNTVLLGGAVLALRLFTEYMARRQLDAMTGRPSKLRDATEVVVSNNTVAANGNSEQYGDVESSLVCQPLQAWAQHLRAHPTQPFRTRGILTALLANTIFSVEDMSRYALRVQLSPPEAVTPHGVQVDMPGTLAVELGNDWLQQLIGMPAASLYALSVSAQDADRERVGQAFQHVFTTLEQYGLAYFVLQQRATPSSSSSPVIDVISMQPCSA